MIQVDPVSSQGFLEEEGGKAETEDGGDRMTGAKAA